jgi:hypothetical protein
VEMNSLINWALVGSRKGLLKNKKQIQVPELDGNLSFGLGFISCHDTSVYGILQFIAI